MQPLNDWSGLSYFSQNQSITHNIIRCNVLQTFAIRGWTTFHQFLYQCDVLRYVEKTKDHANYKCKTVHSPPSPCYWQLMGGGGKTSWFQMVCQLARCISLFLNVVFRLEELEFVIIARSWFSFLAKLEWCRLQGVWKLAVNGYVSG